MYRVLTKGGIISPNELLNIIRWAKENEVKSILLGSRQDILIDIQESQLEKLEASLQTQICIIEKNSNSNISSSYVASDIFESQSWVTSASYLYILESIRHQPKIKVNIVDPAQNLVPLFYGDINFIASDIEDYWYLFIKDPNWQKEDYYPTLVNSKDIGLFCREIENQWGATTSSQELFAMLSEQLDTDNRSIQKHLKPDVKLFPYYEGMHRYGMEKFWLGFYRRKNKYNIKVLQQITERCIKDGIANICITPWKSFIIKGIPHKSKKQWEYTLGNQGINVRHSQLEMNWHLPANNFIALMSKQKIVAELQRRDISTYGLTFGIFQPTRPPFTAIAIVQKIVGDELNNSYDILQAVEFNPSIQEYTLYAQDVSLEIIPDLLVELCQKFYLGLQVESQTVDTAVIETNDQNVVNVYQCSECMSIYDAAMGDSINNIPPSTPFEKLPKTYKCSCCEAPISSFSKVVIELQRS